MKVNAKLLDPTRFRRQKSRAQTSDVGIQHRSGCNTYRRTPRALVTSSSTLTSTTSSTGSTSSKILADIKRFAETATFDKDQKPGSFAIFAPYMRSTTNNPLQKRISDGRGNRRSSTSTAKARRRSSILGDPRKSKTDPVHPVTTAEMRNDDIWLSAESEAENGGNSTETRGGRRTKQQTCDSSKRWCSRGVSGQPRRHPRAPRSTDTSASNYHSQPPSSLFPASLLTSPQAVKGKTCSPAMQSLSAALCSPLSTGDSRHPLLSACSVIPASTLTSTHYTTFKSQHAGIAPSSSALLSRCTSAPTEEPTSQSTFLLASLEESEDTVIHSMPQRRRLAPAPTTQLPLPPGYAESFQGPVEVQNYIPRKGSLAAGTKKSPERSPQREDVEKKRRGLRTGGVGETPGSPVERTKERRGFGKVVSGNVDRGLEEMRGRKRGDNIGTGIVVVERLERGDDEESLGKCCRRCEELESEIQRLRGKVRSLRKLITGKGRMKAAAVIGDAWV